ncbi:MAG TPA: hypothetical protein VHA33_08280 [Candidatus Angelobacter sp.]|jgi:hypothetical protein|nr:hypothetical protein [Candidatus Angelobacter sp.]
MDYNPRRFCGGRDGAGILAIESLGVSIVITLIGLYLVRRIIGVEKLRSNHEVVDSEMKG